MRNKAAEVCEKYLSKGDRIYVEGKIKNRKWQAEDGTDRYSTEINVDEFTFLTTKKSAEGATPSEQPPAQPPSKEDDLPF